MRGWRKAATASASRRLISSAWRGRPAGRSASRVRRSGKAGPARPANSAASSACSTAGLPWLHPLRWVQDRIDAWVLRRVRRQPGPVEVQRNRVYIVPTRFGWGFALTVLVMLLGAMNYSNSMAYALAFLLMGLGLVCMHHTHANLVHVSLRAGRSKPVYAGEPAHF